MNAIVEYSDYIVDTLKKPTEICHVEERVSILFMIVQVVMCAQAYKNRWLIGVSRKLFIFEFIKSYIFFQINWASVIVGIIVQLVMSAIEYSSNFVVWRVRNVN